MTDREAAVKAADDYVDSAMRLLDDVSPLPGGGAWVWRFEDAPAELRALSECGGDEDWLVLWAPGSYGAKREWIPWHDRLGADAPDEYRLPCGALVLISSHS